MNVDAHQLAALAAVVEEGTFERAAAALHVTPSAVSQRIRALEQQLGRLVVLRTRPPAPTEAGEVLLRLARQRELLDREAFAEITGSDDPGDPDGSGGADGGAGTWTQVAVAVNADSLATWFADVLEDVAGWPRTTLTLRVEDEDRSASLLRSGAVLGAVTADPAPVQGCSVRPLGRMRYVPCASPDLLDRAGGARGPVPADATRVGADDVDWAALPLVRFGPQDDLQDRLLAAVGVAASPPASTVPTTHDMFRAVRRGLGWAVLPVAQLAGARTGRDAVEAGLRRYGLVRLGDAHVDVELYWQRWRMASALLGRLDDAVTGAAARHLTPPR